MKIAQTAQDNSYFPHFLEKLSLYQEKKQTNIKSLKRKYSEIIVADQGFGMTPSQVETAFEKYQTIENPNSGKVDSFGLGLPIVKQLVELQNGTIEVRSELNKGTEVKLKFPYFLM